MFAASHAVAFFDYFRVPYEVAAGSGRPAAPVGELWLADRDRQASPRLYWLRSPAEPGAGGGAGRRGVAGRPGPPGVAAAVLVALAGRTRAAGRRRPGRPV